MVSPVLAQSPTSSEIRDAVQKQVQQELSSIKQGVATKGFVGAITAKTDGTLTLSNLKNQNRTIVVTGDTTIKLLTGKEGTPADLKVNDFILAMGQVDSQNKMTAGRLLVIKQTDPDKRDAKFGAVTKATATTLTIGDWTAKVSTTTAITTVASGKVVNAKLADIKVGTKVIVVGTVGTSNTLTATAVHLMP